MTSVEFGSSTALVSVERPAEAPKLLFIYARPDAPFVTQLIATAAGESQTRQLRRATAADALKGYGEMTAHKMESLSPSGIRVCLVA